MIDKDKLKSLLDYKDIAVNISGNVIRFNHEIGNDATWQEIEIDNRTIEEIVAFINTRVSKARIGKTTNVA